MKQFTYTITDPIGLHARLAGLLVKAAKELDSAVTVTIEGGDEEASQAAMERFFRETL